MSTNLLFAYGTIADPEFFGYLLKRKPVYAKAWLLDYKLLVNPESGYLFVKPAQGHQVTGQLAEITAEELEILDLWEEVPFYQREVLEVQATAGTLKAFVYTQNQASGIAIGQGKPKERASMLEEIKEFRRWLDRQQNH
tara:strand:- start:12696 stop:13112 length:417 start_codon:yes stop_codon:yes gene_type:complete